MSIMQLCTTEPVEFEFQTSVEQTIDNLASKVTPTGQPQSSDEAMVGKVAKESTYLYRSVRGSRNSFRPTFYGRFSSSNNSTILSGEISLNRVVKKFIIFWCSVVALVAVVTVITVLRNPHASWESLLHVLIMLFGCIAFCHFMIKNSMPDVDWLKAEIERTATR